MSANEIRLLAVFGVLVLGVVAIVASFTIVHLTNAARHLNNGIARGRALPSVRGEARDLARLIDRRQAAWRLRC